MIQSSLIHDVNEVAVKAKSVANSPSTSPTMATAKPKARLKLKPKSKPKASAQAVGAAATPSSSSAQQAQERLQALLHPETVVTPIDQVTAETKTTTETKTKTKTETKAEATVADGESKPQQYAVVVYDRESLEQAQKSGAQRIVVKGELAQKLEAAFKGLRSVGASSLNTLALVLSGAALFAPFTGGVSLGAAGTVMGTVGAALTATAIAAISAIGLSLVIAVFKGYDEIKLAGGGLELRIKKHQDKPRPDAKA